MQPFRPSPYRTIQQADTNGNGGMTSMKVPQSDVDDVSSLSEGSTTSSDSGKRSGESELSGTEYECELHFLMLLH